MPKFHLNLIPVVCRTKDDVSHLANEMRDVSLRSPDKIEGYEASDSEPEAVRKAEQIQDEVIDSGKLRFIEWIDGRVVNVVFTLLDINDQRQWNLSISHSTATENGPQRVADDLAQIIADSFLENSYEEVEPKAIWKNIRHFTKDMI